MKDIFFDIEKFYTRFITIKQYLDSKGITNCNKNIDVFKYKSASKGIELSWEYHNVHNSDGDTPRLWLNILVDEPNNICLNLIEQTNVSLVGVSVYDSNDSLWIARGIMRYYNQSVPGCYHDSLNDIMIPTPFTEEMYFQYSTLYELRWEYRSYQARIDFVDTIPDRMTLSVLGEKMFANFSEEEIAAIENGFDEFENMIKEECL